MFLATLFVCKPLQKITDDLGSGFTTTDKVLKLSIFLSSLRSMLNLFQDWRDLASPGAAMPVVTECIKKVPAQRY